MIARANPQPPKTESIPPMRPGANMRMGRNPLGFWMEGPVAGADFSHPFPVNVSGSDARVGRGLILANIGVEPVIGSQKVPISGDDRRAQPSLRLDASLVNDSNESWVCVEVTPDEDGNLDEAGKKSKVEVVQRDHPNVMVGDAGRVPLAMLFLKNGRWQVFQIAMFHFRYVTSKPAVGPRKHYFL